MSDHHYSDIGENISKTVQEAIDSQDFSKLSSTIQELVGNAVTDAMGEVGEEINKAADIIAGRTTFTRQMPEYMRNKVHNVQPPQNPWNGVMEDYLSTKDIPRNALFSNGGLSRWKGYLLFILGIAGIMGTASGLLIALIAGAFTHAGMLPLEIVLAILLIACSIVTAKGYQTISKLKRFKNYLKRIGNRVSISVKELMGVAGKSEKDTVKDLETMIADNMFLQGHFDVDHKNLFVTDESYQTYMKEWNEVQERRQEQERERQMNFVRQEQEKLNKEQERQKMPPEIRELLQSADMYVNKIHMGNDAIEDQVVTDKLNDLEGMTIQIFDYVKEHPESARETKKLMKYYLPTTIKLLDSYQKLNEAQKSGLHPEQTVNIEKSKKEIEETLDTLNLAFARLFDNLYQDTSMDISADISVLNTMLAQEGLVGDTMTANTKEEPQGQVLQSH